MLSINAQHVSIHMGLQQVFFYPCGKLLNHMYCKILFYALYWKEALLKVHVDHMLGVNQQHKIQLTNSCMW
jgi:hypothetical protein